MIRGSIVVLVTPASENGVINYAALKHELTTGALALINSDLGD